MRSLSDAGRRLAVGAATLAVLLTGAGTAVASAPAFHAPARRAGLDHTVRVQLWSNSYYAMGQVFRQKGRGNLSNPTAQFVRVCKFPLNACPKNSTGIRLIKMGRIHHNGFNPMTYPDGNNRQFKDRYVFRQAWSPTKRARNRYCVFSPHARAKGVYTWRPCTGPHANDTHGWFIVVPNPLTGEGEFVNVLWTNRNRHHLWYVESLTSLANRAEVKNLVTTTQQPQFSWWEVNTIR